MKKFLISIFFLILFITVLFCGISYQTNPFSEYDQMREEYLFEGKNYISDINISNSYIVSFDTDVSLNKIHSSIKAYKFQPLAKSDERVFLIELSDPTYFIEKNQSIIKYLKKDNQAQFSVSVNDQVEIFDEKTYQFDFNELNDFQNSTDIIIAVLDSGVNRNHVALQGAKILEGYDAVSQNVGVIEDNIGHGTSVIGMFSAVAKNPTNVQGLLEQSTILPINVTDTNGDISSSVFIRAIYYAVDSGADIINMSFCGSEFNDAEQAAIDYAFEKGCILVAATGNFHNSAEYQNIKTFPSCYDHVISVSSINKYGELSEFSFFNDNIDIAALGEQIRVISGVTDKAAYIADGTSYSAPYVSALASIILSNLDEGVTINSDEMAVLLRDNAYIKNKVRCLSPLNAFSERHKPIVCGIEDGKTYFKNVIITFNHGVAFLDGVEIKSGTKVNYNGKHSLVIVKDEYLINYLFTTDNIPLEFECPEGNVYYNSINITFDRGTATLNGEPYYSGKIIDKSGYYTFILNGPYGNKVEKSFTLYLDVPEVHGVKNNSTYDRDVIFKVVGNGKAYLNSEEIEVGTEIICSDNKDYILVLSNYDGSKKNEIYFTIHKSGIESHFLDLSECDLLIDEQFFSAYIYSNKFSGIRIFSNDDFSSIKKVILTEGDIIDLLFYSEYLICLTDQKIYVISRESSSVVFEYDAEDISDIATDNKYIYVLRQNSLCTFDVSTGEFDARNAFDNTFDTILYYKAIDSIIMYNQGNTEIMVYSCVAGETYLVNLSKEIDILLSDDNMLYSNNIIFNSEFKVHSVIKDFVPKFFIDGVLISDNLLFDVEQCKFVGVLSKKIASLFISNNDYYVLDDKGCLCVYPQKETILQTLLASDYIEDEPYYVISDNLFDTTVKLNDKIQIKQWLYNRADNNLYLISHNSNILYILDSEFKTNKKISLKDTPTYISIQNGRIVIYFDHLKEAFVIYNEEGTYHALDYDLDIISVVGDGDNFALSNGSIYKLNGCTADLFINRNDILSIGYLSALYNIIAYTSGGSVLKIDAINGEVIAEIVVNPQGESILCKGNYFILGNTLFDGIDLVSVGVFDNKVLDYKENIILLNNGIYTISNNSFTSLGFQSLYSIFENNCIFSYTENNEIIKYKNPYDFYAGELPELIIEGELIGDHYLGDVKVFYDYGIGYVDGYGFNSGDIIENGGTHRITIMLPYGQTVDKVIKIETSIKTIEIIGVDEIKVNDNVKFDFKYYPIGANEEMIFFSSVSENVSVTDEGIVYGLKEGEAEIICSTVDGRVVSVFTLKVLPFELIISNNRFDIDSSNRYLTNIPCYMRASELLRFINYNSGSARIIDFDNNVVKTHGYLATGMWMEILNRNNEVILKYQLALNGDIDGDGYVLASDYYLLGKHVFKSELLSDCQLEAADATNDGKVNVADLLKVSSHLLNKSRLYSTKDSIKSDEDLKFDFIDTDIAIAGGNYKLPISFRSTDINVIRGKIIFDRTKFEFEDLSLLNNGWKVDLFDDGTYLNFVIYNENFKPINASSVVNCSLDFVVSADCVVNDSLIIELIDIETENGLAGNKNHTVTIKDDQDSTLISDLVLNNGDLSLDFKKSVFKYNITVPYNVDKIEIDYTLLDQNASVEVVNPDLEVGYNTITIKVSKDSAYTVYNISVFRQSEDKQSSESRAQNITINAGTLTPSFSLDVFEYTITLDRDTEVGFGIVMLDVKASYSIIEESFGYTVRCIAENGDITDYKFIKDIIYDFSTGEIVEETDRFWLIVIILSIVALGCIISTLIYINRNKKV